MNPNITPPSNTITRRALRDQLEADIAQVDADITALQQQRVQFVIALEALQAADGVSSRSAPVQSQSAPRNAVKVPVVTREPENKSAMILAIVKETPGLAPKQIVEQVQSLGHDLPHGEVYTYLHRHTKRGTIVSRGGMGKRKYYPGKNA